MVKKYIIMAGGNYKIWETPRHLSKINGEEVIARTIRLLKENGITDISISANNPIFEKFGLPILKHYNSYDYDNYGGHWYDAFHLIDEPCCYIFGDVVFSPEAIKKIVETDTDDIELFGSTPPFAKQYIKDHIEAFALKVKKPEHLKQALEKTIELEKQGKFWRKPLIWEVWIVIKDTPLQKKEDEYLYNYTAINDYTCDIDWKGDVEKIKKVIGGEMIKVEVIKNFTLERFNELKNIERAKADTYGKLYVGDKFECEKDLADYLLGDNRLKEAVVKLIEIIPLIQEEEPILVKEEKKTTKSKKKKK